MEVLWIFNQQFAGWEAKLPTQTHDRLQDERDHAIHHKGAMVKREKFPAQDELKDLSSGDVSSAGICWCAAMWCDIHGLVCITSI